MKFTATTLVLALGFTQAASIPKPSLIQAASPGSDTGANDKGSNANVSGILVLHRLTPIFIGRLERPRILSTLGH